MWGRTAHWRYGIAITLLCLATGDAAARSAGNEADAFFPVCATEARWTEKRAQTGLDDGGGCTGAGPCDDPAVRDAAVRRPIVVRAVVHVMASATGRLPNGIDAEAVAAQMAQLGADFGAHGISFRYETRFHDDASHDCIPAYSPSNSAWRAAIDAMKSDYAEDPGRRINVFVSCQSTGAMGTLMGIGTFPWDPDALTGLGGVWINSAWFGANHHTLTHEMGHTLGLLHTHHGAAGDNCDSACREQVHAPNDASADYAGDFCMDTPATPANYTCDDPPGTDCNGMPWTAYGPAGAANFMGYAPDHCASHFTPNQRARMHCWTTGALGAVLLEDCGAPCDEERTPRAVDVALENHPNPANPSTTFHFSLPSATRASLHVYDVSGRLVAALVDEPRGAGVFDVNWDGKDRSGGTVPSGVYYARLSAGNALRTRRVVVLK